ncbi:MAG: ABC transporter permease [Chloroflexota bacterium]
MSRFLVLLKRELRSITKEKTIMFAIIVQFFIASFSSIILVGIMAFYDPASIGENTNLHVRAGIVGGDERVEPLLNYLDESNVRLRFYPDMTEAEDAFRRGRVDTILVLPETTGGVVDMQLIMPELDAKETVIFMVLDEPLKRYENYLRQSAGIDLHYDSTGGKPHTTYEFLYSLIVPILMLFPALIAGSIVIDTVSEEFENKTFDTLAVAPVSLGQVVSSKITAAVVTAAVQVVMWVGLLRLNSIVIQNAPLVILLGIVIAAAISVLTAVMALYFKDRERTQFVYSIVLVALIGGSYFLNPSPFGLITRLAAGDPSLGIFQVLLYAIPLAVAGIIFLKVSRRLVLSRR